MNRDAMAAHMRLAALPAWGRKTPPDDEYAKRSAAAQKARRTRLQNRAEAGPPKGRLPNSIQSMFKPKGRAPVDRHGFVLREAVEIVSGKHAGQRGHYDGSVDATRVFVMTAAGRRSVYARFVRREGTDA